MSHKKAISVGFKYNDGGLTRVVNPECSGDIYRLYERHGQCIGRILLLRQFWIGIKRLEKLMKIQDFDQSTTL